MPSAHDMRERDNSQQLVELLVDPKHRQLYMSSAQFNHQLNQLVRILPLWVEFLAQQATASEEWVAAERQRLESQTIDPSIMRDMRLFG